MALRWARVFPTRPRVRQYTDIGRKNRTCQGRRKHFPSPTSGSCFIVVLSLFYT